MQRLFGLLGTLMALSVHAETVNFDGFKAGELPAEWLAGATGRGSARWAIEADESAPSKPNVFRQSGVADFPWCVLKGTAITDGFVEVKFKALGGKSDQAGGLVWRWKDGNNYYVARANALDLHALAPPVSVCRSSPARSSPFHSENRVRCPLLASQRFTDVLPSQFNLHHARPDNVSLYYAESGSTPHDQVWNAPVAQEIIVFDITGLELQAVAASAAVYERAVKTGRRHRCVSLSASIRQLTNVMTTVEQNTLKRRGVGLRACDPGAPIRYLLSSRRSSWKAELCLASTLRVR